MITQPQPQPLARRSDPLTSYLAADKAQEFASGHKQKIMQAMHVLIQATAKEIADLICLTVVQVDRRISELLKSEELNVAQICGIDFTRNGYRVLEVHMSDQEREEHINMLADVIVSSIENDDIMAAHRASNLRSALIKCRSANQVKKLEKVRGLV